MQRIYASGLQFINLATSNSNIPATGFNDPVLYKILTGKNQSPESYIRVLICCLQQIAFRHLQVYKVQEIACQQIGPQQKILTMTTSEIQIYTTYVIDLGRVQNVRLINHCNHVTTRLNMHYRKYALFQRLNVELCLKIHNSNLWQLNSLGQQVICAEMEQRCSQHKHSTVSNLKLVFFFQDAEPEFGVLSHL